MRIAVNTRLLLPNKLDGIGYFTYKTLEKLVKDRPEDEFIFLFDRKYDQRFIFSENIEPVVIPCQARHPVLWKIYFDYLTPYYLKKHRADIYFSPDGFIPKGLDIPVVNTMHDLNYEHNPEYIEKWSHRKYLLRYFPRFSQKADKLITVSEFSKRDIKELYDIEGSKIDVVYNAANEAYYMIEEKEKQETKEKYADGNEFFYFVGSIHKRKNLGNMFKAFDIFKTKTGSKARFIIIGDRRDWKGELEDIYLNLEHKEDIVFTGRLEAEEINKIANSAIALMFVSQFEGFGIPIVEAFAAGCPVITSNTTSMPEVGGEAALYANPFNVEKIAEAMIRLHKEPELRAELIGKGLEENKRFSWELSAKKLWETIEEAYKA